MLGEAPSFLVQASGDLFLVNSVPKPYTSDPSSVIACSGAHPAAILKEHRAWISVEILHPEAVSAANYCIVGHVIAGLMNADVVALFHPESRRLVVPIPTDTRTQLESMHPLQAVFEVPFC